MVKTPDIHETLGDGSGATIKAMHPTLEEAFPDVDLTPVEGTVEEKVAMLNTLIDEKKGKGKNVWTSVSGILIWSRIYGEEAVQKVIDSGRLSF